MHLEICQSLMLSAKPTAGQRSEALRLWLDIAQLKINACQDGDYSFEIHESDVVKYGHRQGPARVALWDMG